MFRPNNNRDEITINTNEELQDYYATIPPMHNAPLKFNVKNMRTNQHARPPSDILVDLDDEWTIPLFSTVPMTPKQMHSEGARIEEIVDEDDEARLSKLGDNEDDDVKSFMNIPHPQQGREAEDDASSIDSIFEDDLPDKQPIHLFNFPDRSPKPTSARSLSRSSRSSARTGSLAGSRSVSSTEENNHANPPPEDRTREQSKSPSSRHSEFDFMDAPLTPLADHLVDPTRGRSRSRSPIHHSPSLSARAQSISKSIGSSRVFSEHPSPRIPTIETTSPRGVPASIDMHSIPSPEPIIVPVPTFHEESMLFQEHHTIDPDPPLPVLPPIENTSTGATAATPSLTNDIALLLDTLTRAFGEHPELSENLRNIVRNASQGVYWNSATEAIRGIRDTVVSDAIQARDVILSESATAAKEISSQAQAEAGRRITEALGNVFRSLGAVLGPSTSSAPVGSAAPPPAPASAAPTVTEVPRQNRGRSDSFLGDPRPNSPALIRATPLIHGQDIPPDARSLSRSTTPSSRPDIDTSLYPNGGVSVSRRNDKHGSQFMPFVWGPSQGQGRDRNTYGSHSHVSPYSYGKHRHHRSHSGPGSAYPPGQPPSGTYYAPPYPYPGSPYGYSRHQPPDPRMYTDPRDFSRDYSRDGYPGIGAGANLGRSNTLPSSFVAPTVPPVTQPATVSIEAPPPPPPPAPPSTSGSVSAAPAVIAVPSAPSSVAASTVKTPTTSVVARTRSERTLLYEKARDDLDDIKEKYKRQKEVFRMAREGRRKEVEEERAAKERERAARERERAERHARRRGRLTGAPPVVPPEPAYTSAPPPFSHSHRDDSSSESGTEKAMPIPFVLIHD